MFDMSNVNFTSIIRIIKKYITEAFVWRLFVCVKDAWYSMQKGT